MTTPYSTPGCGGVNWRPGFLCPVGQDHTPGGNVVSERDGQSGIDRHRWGGPQGGAYTSEREPWGFSLWLSSKESACQCRRHRFNPWSRKISPAVELLSPCTTTTEPVLWSPGAARTEPLPRSYWSLRATGPEEPVLQNKRNHCSEKPALCNWRVVPASSKREQSPRSNKDAAQPKISK